MTRQRTDTVDPDVLQAAASAEPAVLVVTGRASFEAEVLESDLPVVVDFWATWCTPCTTLGRMLGELAPLYADRLKFVKVDISEKANAWAGSRFEITSVPLLLLFVGGMRIEDVDLLGMCTRKELVKWLDQVAST